MEGADKSTELRRHPIFFSCNYKNGEPNACCEWNQCREQTFDSSMYNLFSTKIWEPYLSAHKPNEFRGDQCDLNWFLPIEAMKICLRHDKYVQKFAKY